MQIEERTDGSVVVVSLDGRADGFTGEDLETALSEIVDRGDVKIVLDCRQMTYINSVGLRVLFICARNCKADGGKMVIAGVRPECRAPMDISGFGAIIDFYDSSDEAVSALS